MADFLEKKETSAMVAVAETKEVAEIKAKMYLARQFPRDMDLCVARILRECESPRLAEIAQYEYPKGDSVVKGPSIRLIEVIARHFGNMLSGITELDRNGNRSTVKVYAWDLESNYADEKIFEMDFIRNLKGGRSYQITDEREKYEFMANYAARRKRACIQAVIPGYIIDEAVAACEKTLEAAMKKDKTIEEIRASMLSSFVALAEWVTQDMLGAVCGKDFDKLSTKDIVKLRNLYNAIKDGFVKAEVAFGKEKEGADLPTTEEEDALKGLNEQLRMGADATDKG
jgi:hypothetical protein